MLGKDEIEDFYENLQIQLLGAPPPNKRPTFYLMLVENGYKMFVF